MGDLLSAWEEGGHSSEEKLHPVRQADYQNIFYLGTANFIMQGTNCAVQVVCNSTLQSYGGDIYVGIMTVLNSVRGKFLCFRSMASPMADSRLSVLTMERKKRSGESGNSLYYIDRLRVHHDCLGHDRYFPQILVQYFFQRLADDGFGD